MVPASSASSTVYSRSEHSRTPRRAITEHFQKQSMFTTELSIDVLFYCRNLCAHLSIAILLILELG